MHKQCCVMIFHFKASVPWMRIVQPALGNVLLRRTTFGQLSFAFRGTHEWNRLPVLKQLTGQWFLKKSWKYGYWPLKLLIIYSGLWIWQFVISTFLVYFFLLLSFFLLVLNLVYSYFFVYIFFLSLTSTYQKGLWIKIRQCWLNLLHFTYCM